MFYSARTVEQELHLTCQLAANFYPVHLSKKSTILFNNLF